MYQVRSLAQHRRERCGVSENDCLYRALEARDLAIVSNGVGELLEIRPGVESVFLRDDQPCIGKIQCSRLDSVHCLATKARMLPLEAPLGRFLA